MKESSYKPCRFCGRASIIDALDEESVVRIILQEDKKLLEFEEDCDNHFSLKINKECLSVLISELKDIHNQMVD